MTHSERLVDPLTVRQASAALRMPERSIRRHLKRGTIQGMQLAHLSPWVIPVAEVERVARLLWITPDWQAVEVADVTKTAKGARQAVAAPTLEP